MWRGPMLNKWIQNFLANTHWGELDYLLLDLPPGTGDVAIDVAAMIPQAKEIIVTTPHNVASFVASRVGVMAKHTKHEILGIVENMAYYEEQDGSKIISSKRRRRNACRTIANRSNCSNTFCET